LHRESGAWLTRRCGLIHHVVGWRKNGTKRKVQRCSDGDMGDRDGIYTKRRRPSRPQPLDMACAG
jgi:hypothetical protein